MTTGEIPSDVREHDCTKCKHHKNTLAAMLESKRCQACFPELGFPLFEGR